jgi:hypothetical protein
MKRILCMDREFDKEPILSHEKEKGKRVSNIICDTPELQFNLSLWEKDKFYYKLKGNVPPNMARTTFRFYVPCAQGTKGEENNWSESIITGPGPTLPPSSRLDPSQSLPLVMPSPFLDKVPRTSAHDILIKPAAITGTPITEASTTPLLITGPRECMLPPISVLPSPPSALPPISRLFSELELLTAMEDCPANSPYNNNIIPSCHRLHQLWMHGRVIMLKCKDIGEIVSWYLAIWKMTDSLWKFQEWGWLDRFKSGTQSSYDRFPDFSSFHNSRSKSIYRYVPIVFVAILHV